MTTLIDLQDEISSWKVSPSDALAQIGYDEGELEVAAVVMREKQYELMARGKKKGYEAGKLLNASLETAYALGFILGVMAEKEKQAEGEGK